MLKYKTCVFLSCFIGSVLLLFHGIYILLTLEELEKESIPSVNDGTIFESNQYKEYEYPVLLWWTPFTGDRGTVTQCGAEKCFFTQNRSYLNSKSLRALLFYGSDFNPVDLPLPRKDFHDWALLHEESPKNNFLFCTKEIMELFNHTATFRRESDFPLTLQYLDSLDSLTSHKYFKSTDEKDKEQNNLAPVVYVQSDCNTPSERDSYVAELMKYIKIDSYGKCLHNKDLPHKLSDPIEGMDDAEFWQLLSKYKFSLAFENAICKDYITEKLWRPLIVGSVPIYYGSPNIVDWLPNNKAAIIASKFDSPKLLANYLHYLNSNRTAYEYHLHHKLLRIIQNDNLKDVMQARKWGINNDFEKGNFIEHFQCFVCERVSRNFKGKGKEYFFIKYQASLTHYGCPMPVSPLRDKSIPPTWWNELYEKARYEALAIRQLMTELPKFREKEYYDRVMQLLQARNVKI